MMLIFLLAVFAASAVWEIYYRTHWPQQVTVELWFETDVVYAGQETLLYEVIENRKRMPVPVLEVGFHARKELDFAGADNTNISDYIYKRDIFSVLGRQRITREIAVTCKKRGRYTVKEADIFSHALLYNRHYSRAVSTDAALFVYPKLTDVSDVMTVCEHMLGVLQCARRLYEDPFTFRSIRGYTIQDPMKSINWKASAKTGTLMVNTFDSVRSQKAMLFLDVEDTGILKCADLVEESIAVAAAVVRKLIGQSVEVGFAYNVTDGAGWIEPILPSNKKGTLIQIEQGLAQYCETDSTQDFGELIDGLFDGVLLENPLGEDTLLIYISKNINHSHLEKIITYAGSRQTLVVKPVYCASLGDGNQQLPISDLTAGRENVQVLIREVGRS